MYSPHLGPTFQPKRLYGCAFHGRAFFRKHTSNCSQNIGFPGEYCINQTYLDLGLREEPGPDFEGDDVVARHGADGAAHEGAPVRVAVVDLAAEGVVVVRLPPRSESENFIRSYYS